MIDEQKKKSLIAYDELEQQLKWIEGDNVEKMSDQELLKNYREAAELYNFYFILQNVTKTLCNSVYGGFGTPSLRYYNREVARDITGEAKNACQVMEQTGQKYFKDVWPKDVEFHKDLHEKFPEIMKENVDVKSIEKDIVITCDTDSVSKESIVSFIDDVDEVSINLINVTIEEFVENYCQYEYSSENKTEYFSTDYFIPNYSEQTKLHFSKPLFVSRHKVTKDKWLLELTNNKTVETTADHSMIVYRMINGSIKKLSVKPNEVQSEDQCLYWSNNLEEEPIFVEVKSCKRIGQYLDEYVYDISMRSDNIVEEEMNLVEDIKTFFANGILVHNSNYLTFDYVFQSIGIDPMKVHTKSAVEFIVHFMKTKMDPIYDKVLTKMIEQRNGKNYMIFELEAIGGFGIFLAKKKYAFAMLWKDGKYIADQNKLKVTGIELKQKAAPKEIRETMKSFVNMIFVRKGVISSELFFGLCKSVKDRLKTYEIPALSKSTRLNKYSEYVIDDKEKVILRPKTPVTVRGSANYNHLIQKNNLQSEYPLLKNGMSIKIYYDTTGQPFAYPTEYGYPKEFVPTMSADIQIEKMLFAPIKRLVSGLIDGDVKQMGSDKMQQSLSSIMNKFKK